MRVATAVDLVVSGDPDRAEQALKGVEGVTRVAREGAGGVWKLHARFAKGLPHAARASATEACVAAVVAAGAGVRDVRAAGGSLEEVFAALTDTEPAAEHEVTT